MPRNIEDSLELTNEEINMLAELLHIIVKDIVKEVCGE